MLKGLLKQKRELTFAAVTLVLVTLLIFVSVISFRFLSRYITEALTEPRVPENEITRFNFVGFEALNLPE